MNYLRLDTRALALMRICVSAVVLIDLGIRLTDLEAFYANTGVVPLSLVFEHTWNIYYVSLHAISGLWQFQLLLFSAAILFASLMLIGYRTTLFTALSWFMMLSLHNRNSLILQGGDDLLRMTLFWCIFLPWGRAYSCDALLSTASNTRKWILSAASVAYVLQVTYIYTGSALLKGPEWHTNYSAMYYVYGLDQIAYPVTRYLLYHPTLLKIMTVIAWYFELLVPVLFFIPFKHQFFRTAGVALICGFHFFNLLTLLIGLFPLIGMATSIGILPSSAMDRIERLTQRLRPIVRESFHSYALQLKTIIPWREPAAQLPVAAHRFRTAGLIFLLIFVFDWNFSNLSFVNSKLSDSLRIIGYTLRLDQNWGMFAPGVFKDDGWFLLEGTTVNGEKINLLSEDLNISYDKPESVTAMFKNDRWRKYSENLILTFRSFMRGYYVNYRKRLWNETHPDRKLKKLELVYMSEFTLPDYRREAPKREVLWIVED